MKRTVLAITVAMLASAFLVQPAFAKGSGHFVGQDNQNCGDFGSRKDAQAHLDADKSDPDGLDALPGPADGNDQRNQGGHGDGIACEAFNYPNSGGDPAPTTTSGSGGNQAGTLPRTGGATIPMLGTGVVFLLLGALLLRRTRSST